MAVKDRLPELQNAQSSANKKRKQKETVIIEDSRIQHVENVLKEVDRIQTWINDIRENTRMMKRLYSDSTYHTSKGLQEDFNSRMALVIATGNKVFGALKEFESSCTSDIEDKSAPSRIKRLQYATLKQQYAEVLQEHETFLEKYRKERIAMLKEQAKLTNKLVSNEECHLMIEEDTTSLFVDNYLAETAEAKQALQDVQARHVELVKVENSIRTIRDMFIQMMRLVQYQQDKVDRVEYYATVATDYVDHGTANLSKAEEKRKRYRKRKNCIIISVIGILAFIIVILLLV